MNRSVAADLAHALFDAAVLPPQPQCPLYGGQTSRFLGANRLRCMLCSNDGDLEMIDGVARLDIRRRDHRPMRSRSRP